MFDDPRRRRGTRDGAGGLSGVLCREHGAAAALLGLLFVAVAIAPARTVGAGAPVERQVVAESVFTALINAFFVSMGGAIPDFSLGGVALVVSLFSLVQTLHVGRRLWPRRLDLPSLARRLALVLVGLALYGLEFAAAAQLVRAPVAGKALISQQISVRFGIYAFGIGRSWELLGARRGTAF
jgi:hypothetical protein